MYPSRISCSLVTLTGIALSSPVIAEALGVVRYAQSQAPPTNTISTSTAMIGYQFSSLLRVVFTMIPFDMRTYETQTRYGASDTCSYMS